MIYVDLSNILMLKVRKYCQNVLNQVGVSGNY